jgi:beta-lactamase superfamily II metal-dependent hydrolase
MIRGIELVLAFIIVGSPGRGLAAQDPAVTLHFLDVGQGDAVVIQSPEGKVALVDAGPSYIVHLLHALGIDSVDLAIASHAHLDHIGGMLGVIQSMPVRYYMDNGVEHNTSTYTGLMGTLVASDHITYLEATQRTVSLGSVEIQVLPPPDWAKEQNLASVGLIVEYGEFRALLTGDSEIEELNHFLDMGLPQVTVLKAAHHGSRDAVSPRWVDVTRPEVVVISVGANNEYGHPDPWALRYYQAVTEEIYRTDVHGTVTIVGHRDGSYEVTTGRRELAEGSRDRSPLISSLVSPAPSEASGPVSVGVLANPPGNDNENLNAEYAVIRNYLSESLVITNWTLCDAANHCFTFPQGTSIAPGDSVFLRTGIGSNTSTDFYLNQRQAIWNNRGDVATLYDERGRVVVRYKY